ncbi:MAG TPA: DUF6438 domain-containing protein [Candidatus Angelobacter sp.]|nr:DUF6438 domain-containing protein [Candidatus Angelobacter sp.]
MRKEAVVVRGQWPAFCSDFLFVFSVIAMLDFVILRLGLSHGATSFSGALFYRGFFRIYDLFLFLSRTKPEFFSRYYPRPPGFASAIAAQLVYVISSICLAALVVILIRALVPGRVARYLLHPWVAFAGLLVWLISWWQSNGVGAPLPQVAWPGWLIGFVPRVSIFHACVLLLSAAISIFMTFRRKGITGLGLFSYGVFFVLHFGFWFVTWRAVSAFWMAILAVTVFATCCGIVWMRRTMEGNPQPEKHNASLGSTLAVSLFSAGLLLLMFLPPRAHSVSRLNDLSSLKIKLERTGCFGNCPIYSITIDGSGKVTYLGERFVAKNGPEVAVIRPDQVRALLEDIDRVGFFGLDDRMFDACADTPRAVIFLSLEGREQTVVSDTTCVGPQSGIQAKVVASAAEIDRVVDSNRWIH